MPPSLCVAFLCLSVAFNLSAAEAPSSAPRATLGDSVVEPAWLQGLTITVGPSHADLVGANEKAIQAAVDYAARFGGGTVRILPGTYRLRNAIYLQSNVRIVGSGADTVLIKEPSVTTTLAADSDWFDQEITLADATGFAVGDGVCIRAKVPSGGSGVAKRTLVARTGNRFKLDQGLRQNFWRIGETTVSTLYPILSGENISDIAIENLVLDGDRAHNANLDGNYAGCIFLQECNRVIIRGVTAQNFNGDGISWQICHDVVVEDCTSQGNVGLGLHPGSGSQRPIIRRNRLLQNDIGLFFCWGVRQGVAEGNHIEGNRVGVSIGHHDTDNLISQNEIVSSTSAGVVFRPERGKDFTGNRNRIANNRLIDNGPENGFAVDIQGGTQSIDLAGNEIVDRRGAGRRTAIRMGPETQDIRLDANRIEGFSKTVEGSAAPKAETK